jgi:hypothetical protein
MLTDPDKFVIQFNESVPGAHRLISEQDIRDMTKCGLIGKHGGYFRSEIQTVIAILSYEELRNKRIQKCKTEIAGYIPTCKGCGQPLKIPPPEKKGRHREYCPGCEHSRSRERSRKWRTKRKQF